MTLSGPRIHDTQDPGDERSGRRPQASRSTSRTSVKTILLVRLRLTRRLEAVCGEAFNVGDESQNFTVREIATIVSVRYVSRLRTVVWSSGPETAGYRVSFDKDKAHLPTCPVSGTLN